MMVAPSSAPSHSAKANTAKLKVAKTARVTKPSALSRKLSTCIGPKKPVKDRILSALKELLDLGISAPPRVQIALFSGNTNLQSRAFKSATKELIADG